MKRLADWIWSRPSFCRVSGEHVPDPADLFMHDARCLRCERVYDDAIAQQRLQPHVRARATAPAYVVDRRGRVRSAS